MTIPTRTLDEAFPQYTTANGFPLSRMESAAIRTYMEAGEGVCWHILVGHGDTITVSLESYPNRKQAEVEAFGYMQKAGQETSVIRLTCCPTPLAYLCQLCANPIPAPDADCPDCTPPDLWQPQVVQQQAGAVAFADPDDPTGSLLSSITPDIIAGIADGVRNHGDWIHFGYEALPIDDATPAVLIDCFGGCHRRLYVAADPTQPPPRCWECAGEPDPGPPPGQVAKEEHLRRQAQRLEMPPPPIAIASQQQEYRKIRDRLYVDYGVEGSAKDYPGAKAERRRIRKHLRREAREAVGYHPD